MILVLYCLGVLVSLVLLKNHIFILNRVATFQYCMCFV